MKTPVGARLANEQQLEVTIEKLVAGGEGLARFEGVPIFVPRSAPGDRLRVELTERRPDYGRAEIVEILSPGLGRREPPCPHFSQCGGCDLQHLEDGLQAELKVGAARETLERIGGLKLPDHELVAGSPWGYRLRAQLHTEISPERGVLVGYHARRSHELVAVTRCPVLVPELEAELAELPKRFGPLPPKRLDLAAGEGGRIASAPPVAGLADGEMELTIGARTYAFDARCFFQAHRGLIGRLIEAVVGEEKGELAFDLYAGVGLFSLPLAERYGRVVAVEGDRLAARFARTNVRRNRLSQVEVVSQAIETWSKYLPEDAPRVVVDPPRSGLASPILKALVRRPPRRLTYVSCHAATLARDLKELKESYHLEQLTFLDLFPQTGHLESVVQLVRL